MSDAFDRPEGDSAELIGLEQSLGRLTPTPPRIDRDRLMFFAGQASASVSSASVSSASQMSAHETSPYQTSNGPVARPTARDPRGLAGRFWPASSAVLAATTLTLAVLLGSRPAPQPRIVYRDPITPSETSRAQNTASHPTSDQANGAPAAWNPAEIVAEPALPGNYLRTRDVALRMGLDALGSPNITGGSSAPAKSYGELLHGLMQDPRGVPASGMYYDKSTTM
jgi:hypothetical protein